MHRKGHRGVTKRKVHKGGYYGFDGAVGTGAPSWGRGSEAGPFMATDRGGNAQYGSSRRSKTARRSKKSKRRHRKHRGGSRFSTPSASFQGKGSNGIADYVPVVTRESPGTAAGGAFNNFGAQPGSGHSSFIMAGPK